MWTRHCLVCGEIVGPEIYRHRVIQSSLRDRLAKVVAQKRARKSRDVVSLGA